MTDLNSFFVYSLSFIYKEDRHVALTARSAVNATWRGAPLTLRGGAHATKSRRCQNINLLYKISNVKNAKILSNIWNIFENVEINSKYPKFYFIICISCIIHIFFVLLHFGFVVILVFLYFYIYIYYTCRSLTRVGLLLA